MLDTLPSSVGYMLGPVKNRLAPDDNDRPIGLDNGCFKRMVEEPVWRALLAMHEYHRQRVLFVVVPDVYGSHSGTVAQWPHWSAVARDYGYPLAFVAQNGFEATDVPWDEFEVLFIGGNNAFKLSEDGGWYAVHEGQRRGKFVHMGRVNGWTRYAACLAAGVDSCDGTALKFEPDVKVRLVRAWDERGRTQRTLGFWNTGVL